MELLGISFSWGPYEEIAEMLRVLHTKKAWEPLTGTTEMEGDREAEGSQGRTYVKERHEQIGLCQALAGSG